MARPLRLDYPGAVLHITCRGNEQRPIFRDNEDRRCFLDLLEKVVRRFSWIVTAYVLMTNHFHLLIELTAANLSRGMHWLNSTYSLNFNRRHDRVGHLYQGRFGHRLIDKDSYMLEVLRYVVLNPVRAEMVAQPEDYEWSSYRATAGLAPAPDWLEVDEVLALFGGDREGAMQAYRRFVHEGIGSDRSPWDDLTGQVYLGDQTWLQEVRSRIETRLRSQEHPLVQRDPVLKTMRDVISSVAQAVESEEDWLRCGRGGSGRALAAWLGRYEAQLGLSSIGAALRLSSGQVSKLIRQCDEALSRDENLRQSLDDSRAVLHQVWKSIEGKT